MEIVRYSSLAVKIALHELLLRSKTEWPGNSRGHVLTFKSLSLMQETC